MKRSFLLRAIALAALALSSGPFSHAFPFPGEGPSLAFNSPENGATGVAVNSPVTFFFTEEMAQTHSIEWSSNVNPANLSYSWSFGMLLTVTPPQGGFPANATITWKLNPTANNANNFKSASGTELPVGQFQGSFTTAAGGSGDPNDPCNPNGGDNGLGFGSIYKVVNYTQTGDQAPVLDTESAAVFTASYRGASNQTVNAVSITGPGVSMNLTNAFGFFFG